MSRISKLSKLSNISRIGTSTSSTLRRAFGFDGTDDYISSNATIGRTGYNMNVSGNVSTGSDGDGSYIQFNGNSDYTAGTGTRANIGVSSSPSFTQATSFTIKVRVKVITLPPNNASGLFGSDNDACINTDSTGNDIIMGLRGSTLVANTYSGELTLGVLYDIYMSYDATTGKFHSYKGTSGGASVLLNAGGTSGPATFTTNSRYLGDSAFLSGNPSSSNKYIYHAAIRNKALTQAEIDADIALGNTAKNDPSIVAYYIPDNLQYNTQYMLNSSDFSNASRTKTNTTVTADTTVAPDGTTTADTLTIGLGATSGVTQISTVVSGATVASKVFIVKAFVKVSAATSLFRLVMYQNGVATGTSANLTATTDRQEFTFTQTFTASTSATGITGGIINDSTGLIAPVIIAWKCRVYLTNETLRDESPNIGGFIGWKTPLVMSARVKPDIDSTNSFSKQVLFQLPRHYMQIRDTDNQFHFRSDTRIGSRSVSGSGLGTGFRGKVHVLGVKYRDGTGRMYKAFVNGGQVGGLPSAYSSSIAPAGTIYRTNASVGFYTTYYRDGNIRDIRAYTFTGSFTDADALAIYNGGEPTSSGVTKYLHYKPPVGEVGTTTQDQSTNDRDGTLNGGVTRNYI